MTARTIRAVGKPDTIRVLLVDDHPLWRRTLRELLAASGTMEVVADVGTGSEAVQAAAREVPDVILMDVDLPDLNGIEASARILQAQPDVRILALSSSEAPGQVREAVRAGVSGYLVKTAAPDEVTAAVTRVHGGQLVFSAALGSVVRGQLRGQRHGLDDLSERERGVLALMAEGCSNAAIATRLSLSPKTVETHASAIFTKLGLESTAEQHRRVLAVVTYLRG